jgi:hypothetical protein
MVYSEYHGPASSTPNCIGWATAPLLSATFTPYNQANPFCGPVGFLDPSLFVAPDGIPYLLWSEEPIPAARNSAIYIAPLTPNGLSFNGPPVEMLSFASAASINGYCTCDEGGNAELENPSLTADDYNGYDLTFSLGTWYDPGDYITGSIACPTIYSSDCSTYASQGFQIMSNGSASVATDNTPNLNWMFYDVYKPSSGIRYDQFGETGEVDCDNGACP